MMMKPLLVAVCFVCLALLDSGSFQVLLVAAEVTYDDEKAQSDIYPPREEVVQEQANREEDGKQQQQRQRQEEIATEAPTQQLLLEQAQAKVDQLRKDAQARQDSLLQQAQEKANQLRTEAKSKAEVLRQSSQETLDVLHQNAQEMRRNAQEMHRQISTWGDLATQFEISLRAGQQRFHDSLMMHAFQQRVGWNWLRHSIRNHVGVALGVSMVLAGDKHIRGNTPPPILHHDHDNSHKEDDHPKPALAQMLLQQVQPRQVAVALQTGQLSWQLLNLIRNIPHKPWLVDGMAALIGLVTFRQWVPAMPQLISSIYFGVTLVQSVAVVLEEWNWEQLQQQRVGNNKKQKKKPSSSKSRSRSSRFLPQTKRFSTQDNDVPVPVWATLLVSALLYTTLLLSSDKVPMSLAASSLSGAMLLVQSAKSEIAGSWFYMCRRVVKTVVPLLRKLATPLRWAWKRRDTISKVQKVLVQLTPSAIKEFLSQWLSPKPLVRAFQKAKDDILQRKAVQATGRFIQRVFKAGKPVSWPWILATFGVLFQQNYFSKHPWGRTLAFLRLVFNPPVYVWHKITKWCNPETSFAAWMFAAMRTLRGRLVDEFASSLTNEETTKGRRPRRYGRQRQGVATVLLAWLFIVPLCLVQGATPSTSHQSETTPGLKVSLLNGKSMSTPSLLHTIRGASRSDDQMVTGNFIQDDQNVTRNFISATLNDNMVLQRDVPAVIWGYSKPGATVHATLQRSITEHEATSGETSLLAQLETTADDSGLWRVRFPTQAASMTPHEIDVTSTTGETGRLSNLLFGDVYLCGGQSNMEFSMPGQINGSEIVETAVKDYQHIRVVTIGCYTRSATPLPDLQQIESTWSLPTEESMRQEGPFGRFSAVCWFFGKEISDALNNKVPIGLLNNNWVRFSRTNPSFTLPKYKLLTVDLFDFVFSFLLRISLGWK